MKEFSIKVKNRKQLDKATKILKKQGLKLIPHHNEQWIEDNITRAFEADTAFVVVIDNLFAYHNHDGYCKVVKYKKFKKQNK